MQVSGDHAGLNAAGRLGMLSAGLAGASAGDLAGARRSFKIVLGKAVGEAQGREQRAREGAEQLVAQTFVLPLLKQLRESDRTAPPFAPTQAEKQFRALMDAELAQQLVRAGRFGLVERVARDLLKGDVEPVARPA
jgi:hypothetical protein